MNELAAWIQRLELLAAKAQRDAVSQEEWEEAVNMAQDMLLFFLTQKIQKENQPKNHAVEQAFHLSEPSIKNAYKSDEQESLPFSEEEEHMEKQPQNQTTLIEVIEEIKEDQTIHERISKGQSQETLADRHARTPINDLVKAIGINQQYSFINHLFDKDAKAFHAAVREINTCASYLEADEYIQNSLKNRYKWEEDTVHVIKFIELVERRFLYA
jgi:hypothetical protein